MVQPAKVDSKQSTNILIPLDDTTSHSLYLVRVDRFNLYDMKNSSDKQQWQTVRWIKYHNQRTRTFTSSKKGEEWATLTWISIVTDPMYLQVLVTITWSAKHDTRLSKIKSWIRWIEAGCKQSWNTYHSEYLQIAKSRSILRQNTSTSIVWTQRSSLEENKHTETMQRHCTISKADTCNERHAARYRNVVARESQKQRWISFREQTQKDK